MKSEMEIEAIRESRGTYICESRWEEDVPCMTSAFMYSSSENWGEEELLMGAAVLAAGSGED